MSRYRTTTWFRIAAGLTAAACLLLLSRDGLLCTAQAQQTPEAVFQAGVSAYEAQDLPAAEQAFLAAAEMLRGREDTDPEARSINAQVHLYLGRVAVANDRYDEARSQFREALRRDPALFMDPEADPPKMVTLFEEVRTELRAERLSEN